MLKINNCYLTVEFFLHEKITYAEKWHVFSGK